MGLMDNMAKFMQKRKKETKQSITEFSEELDVSRSTMQVYLKGRGNPTLEMVELMAAKMGVSPELLLSGETASSQARQLLETVKTIADLPADKKAEFTEHFLQLVELLEYHDREEGDEKE